MNKVIRISVLITPRHTDSRRPSRPRVTLPSPFSLPVSFATHHLSLQVHQVLAFRATSRRKFQSPDRLDRLAEAIMSPSRYSRSSGSLRAFFRIRIRPNCFLLTRMMISCVLFRFTTRILIFSQKQFLTWIERIGMRYIYFFLFHPKNYYRNYHYA